MTPIRIPTAIKRRDSIVLVKGARKWQDLTLDRGLQQARVAGAAVVLTDSELTAGIRIQRILLVSR